MVVKVIFFSQFLSVFALFTYICLAIELVASIPGK